MFIKDCDERIELKKLELKIRFKKVKQGEEDMSPKQDQLDRIETQRDLMPTSAVEF
jgi:hypothetical protein